MKRAEMANGGGGHVLDRAWRYGRATSIRLRPRVIPASLLMVRTVLLGCLGWATVRAQTIRPDDLTVLMAADAADLSTPLIWAQERLAGSSRGIRRVHCHRLARPPSPEAIPYLRFFKAVGAAVW